MGLLRAIKSFRWGTLFLSLILTATGLLVIIFPSESMKTGSYIIAGAAFLSGVVQVVNVLANKKRGFGFAMSIIFASLTLVCGLVAIIIPNAIMKLYPMFIGLLIVIDGAFKFQTVIYAKRYKLKAWWFMLFFSMLTIAGGFLTIRLRLGDGEGEVGFGLFSFVLGASILLCGVQNLVSLFFMGRIVSRARFEVEQTAKEIPSEDSVVADSYITTEKGKHKQEILPSEALPANKTEEIVINIPTAEAVTNKEE